MFFVPVSGEAAELETDFPAGDEIERPGSENRTDHLGADVFGEIARRETLADYETHGNRWVQMAARNMANGVGHCQHGEAEHEGHAE